MIILIVAFFFSLKKKKKLKLNEPEPNFTLRRSARKQKVPKSGGNYDMC